MATRIAQELSFEEMIKTDMFVSFYNTLDRMAQVLRATGILSTVASISIIVHILRSHQGLSTTYHRLVFGLSIGDILNSIFGFVLGFIMVPKDYDYFVPGAIGNQATCDAQAFLSHFAIELGLSYNNSICIYYLAIVTFNKKDDYIRKKLEPWLHLKAILLPLVFTSMMLAMNGFNSNGLSCWFVPNDRLPHCMGIDKGEVRDGFTIPCGRGDGEEHPTLYQFLNFVPQIYPLITLAVIVISMTLMYRTVYKVEKRMKKYGIDALRLRKKARNYQTDIKRGNVHRTNESGSRGDNANAFGDNKGFFQWLKIKTPFVHTCCCSNGRPVRIRSNSAGSQKRVILYRAAGYVLGWFLSWTPFMITSFLITSPIAPPAMIFLHCSLHPLQGLFNFIVFMYPKVKSTKKGNRRRRGGRAGKDDGAGDKVSWYRAFLTAYMSRGPRSRTGSQNTRPSRVSNIASSRMSSVPNVVKKWKSSVAVLLSKRARKHSTFQNTDGVSTTNMEEVRSYTNSGQGEDNVLVEAGMGNKETTPISQQMNFNMRSPLVLVEEDGDALKEDGKGEEYLLSSNATKDRVANNKVVTFSEEIK